MKRFCQSFFFVTLLAIYTIGCAEEIPQGDTESTVPELIAFHDVIYPIWHTAYPAKDTAALRAYLNDVNTGFARIEKANLPGILRDRQAAWDKGLAEFKKSVEEYNRATAGKDDQALLNAAEILHARFEMMVRIIRPLSKEVEAFHKVLYVVYHKYLPEKQFDLIKSCAADMTTKAEAITRAALSPRLQSKNEAFQKAAAVLLTESRNLAETCKGSDSAVIEKAVLSVHTAYQSLEKVFD